MSKSWDLGSGLSVDLSVPLSGSFTSGQDPNKVYNTDQYDTLLQDNGVLADDIGTLTPAIWAALGYANADAFWNDMYTNGILKSAIIAEIPASGGVIFNDTFTVAVDTALTAHTPDTGTGWVETLNSSTASVMTSFEATDVAGADLNENGRGIIMTTNPTPSIGGYDIELDLASINSTAGADDPMGMIARYVDADNFYYVRIRKNNDNPNLQLYKRVAAVSTLLDSIDFDLNVSDTLKFEIRDSAKKLYVNDVERLSSFDNSITAAGLAGFSVGNVGVIIGDDMKVNWQIDNFVLTEV